MTKWIDLNDVSGAKLKLASIDVHGTPTLHIFVTNLAYTHPKWMRCMRELGFNSPPSKKYLVRRVDPGVRLVASQFHGVFPAAKLVEMAPEAYMLSLSKGPVKVQTPDERATDVDMRGVVRLGRNDEGFEVFDSLSGRFFRSDNGERVTESQANSPHLFLRLQGVDQPAPEGRALQEALLRVTTGFVRAMDMGEVQHSEDYDAFFRAVFPQALAPQDKEQSESMLRSALDAALVRYVRSQNDVAAEAFSPMARLYDYQPPYRGQRRGDGVVPAPLNIIVQRLLGDTSDKSVLYPNAFDGAGFAFLPAGTQIRAYHSEKGVDDLSGFALEQEGVTWLGRYTAASEVGASALLFNADPVINANGARQDYVDALQCVRSLATGSRAILVLAADDPAAAGRMSAESIRMLMALNARYSVEDVFETAPILSQKSGGQRGLRVFSLRNVEPVDRSAQQEQLDRYAATTLPVLSSWDEVKSHVDETIHRINLKEAESQSIDLERAAANESYQRPYLAFSKIGEARTMVPANLQAASQSYMTRIEAVYGPVDEFVQEQLGMGLQTLSANFSPEQVDGVAVMISRALVGRSSLLADDTGLGKGRQLAAMATWASKRGENVIFVTDRANLFSDLARDLKHIGEWDRFRPLVLNSDGEITYEEFAGAEPTVLAKGTSSAEMGSIMDRNLTMQELQVNIAFLTYSQISNEESAKALWLKNQLANSLVIFDEAHIAAGSDSNIAVQVAEISSLAKHVQFASATWAKTHDNMHIYQRAFPASVSVGTLAETMRKGGDSFSEIFSTMLSAEGALIRREHDLSKLEVEMVIDEQMRARNEDVSDKVADVLGSASFISGDMQQVFIRANAQSVARLRGARDARARGMSAKLFSSSFGAGSVIYQVMKSVQGSLNATHVADIAIDSISKGMKPVIVSDATGESLVESLIDELIQAQPNGERPEFIKMPTLRDMLRHVIYKRLAVVRVEDVSALDVAQDDAEAARQLRRENGDADAQAESATATDGLAAGGAGGVPAAQGLPALDADADAAPAVPAQALPVVEDGVDVQFAFAALPVPAAAPLGVDVQSDDDNAATPSKKRRKRVFKDVLISDLPDMPAQAKELYAAGLAEIEEKIMSVPDLPVIGFDVIAQRLRDAGISVGEISGRKNTLVSCNDAEGLWRIVPRAKSKKAVKATIRAFNNGLVQAVVINRSAAAGVSMHASPQFLDHSRRHLIEHQIPEDPITRIQLLGRVNRYDQLSTPLITTASTGIYGEVRYLMMQNRKLARMSANVRSSRDNAMSLKGVTDLFNIVGKQAVQGFLQDSPLIAKRLGITENDVDTHPEIVNKLTMRIPLLRVTQQEVVYNELYSRMDEILLRAELEGENPLRPNELDIRAKTKSELMFFGDDAQPDEFTSAFDAPVVARRIEWEQDRNPLSYTAVREAAKVNVERLVAEGYLLPCEPDAQPKVNPDLMKKVIDGYHGITRLAHMATDAESYESAMLNFTAAKRAYLKYDWMKKNLKNLVPGALIGKLSATLPGDNAENQLTDLYRDTIVTDVRPPAKESDLLDAGKWKITVVTSGDDRPQTYTLRSVHSGISGVLTKGAITGELSASLFGSDFRTGLFSGRQETMRTTFDMVLRGKRKFEATALTGNMYLAAEWAAATKQGKSTIYTDDSGFRHRVILLDKDSGQMNPVHLPVRIADNDMLLKFLVPLAQLPTTQEGPEEAGREEAQEDAVVHVLDTTFKSALAGLAAVSGVNATRRDSIMAIAPGHLMALSCSPKDVRRLRVALSAGQVGMRKKLLGVQSVAANDPSHVQISAHTSKKEIAKLPALVQSAMRLAVGMANSANIFAAAAAESSQGKDGKVAVLTLQIRTPEQVSRAIDLIRTHSGLEVYASTTELKAQARDAISEVLATRRAQMRLLQEQMRRQVNAAAAVVPTGADADDADALPVVVLGNETAHERQECDEAPEAVPENDA